MTRPTISKLINIVSNMNNLAAIGINIKIKKIYKLKDALINIFT